MAGTVSEHIELQRDLARYGWDIYTFDRELEGRRQELRTELGQAKAAGNRDRLNELGRSLDEYKLALAANKRRWSALRVVQDGIFWRSLSFNRFFIAYLGAADPVSWLSPSFPSEIAAAEEHWQAGRLALLCDLAGCINLGDLLVFDPTASSMQLVEVKESERASEKSRQFQRMEQRIEFLNTGRSDDLAPYTLFGPAARRPRLRTHLSNLADAFDRTAREGAVCVKVGDTYSLTVMDMLALNQLGPHEREAERFLRTRERHEERLGVAWEGAETYMYDSLTRIDRDASHPVPSTAPYSIFPLQPLTCAKLALGYAGYNTTLNLRMVDAALKRRGWTRTALPEPILNNNAFMGVTRGSLIQAVPRQLAEQLVVELLSLGAFMHSLDIGDDQRPDGAEGAWHTAWAWSGEERVWR